jgi:hypothetical protein
LFAVGFILRVLPILKYPHVGGDPFLHYKYSLALLDGRFSVLVPTGDSRQMELYYPPLFHLLSLGFFTAFPNVDPYAIMKILACATDSIQIVPIYFIVHHVTKSKIGGIAASYSLLTVRSDYQMLAWGGYANIAGFVLIAILLYYCIGDNLVLSALLGLALALTHQLSTLLAVAVLVPYYLAVIARRKIIPKSFVGVIVGGVVAFVLFYRYAWYSMFEFYSKYTPIYDQGLYVTAFIFEQIGSLLIVTALLSILVVALSHQMKGRVILLVWAVVPVLLSYAYLFGVHWHGVRWIHFISAPFAIWSGIGISYFRNRKILPLGYFFLFTIQFFVTLQGYSLDIIKNVT